MMMWMSSALQIRAADDAKAKAGKKDEPSKAGYTKLEGKEAPEVGQAVLGLNYVIPHAEAFDDFTLTNFRGKNTMVLAFFKDKNDTDSVDELHGFRDQLGQFKQNGAIVVGISNGSVGNVKWLLKHGHNLHFPLLGDEHSEASQAYGVLENGKVRRVTFVIDRKGLVRKVIDTKDPKKHVEEALDAVKNLKS
jgi:peroxiredoxin Q/BCP